MMNVRVDQRDLYQTNRPQHIPVEALLLDYSDPLHADFGGESAGKSSLEG